MLRNPFVARGMIKSERFWARKSEVRTIYSLLLDSEEEPQSIAIVGLRKIGKSSLLYRIAQKRGAESTYAEQLERTACVMLSMQAMSSVSADQFFAAILEELRSQNSVMSDRFVSLSAESAPNPTQQLRKLLRALDREQYLLVLLLDEFECAAANPNFDRNFFDLLRSMAQELRLAFIVATQHDLNQLWDKSLIASPSSSPFFNFFQTLTLGGFSTGEVDSYLRTLSENAGCPFGDSEVQVSWEVGGGHPFFTNVAAYHLFQLLSQGEDQILKEHGAVWEQITRDSTVQGNFRYYWENLLPSRQQLLAKVARGELEQSLASDARVDLAWLERMGLIKGPKSGTYEPFSRAFRGFLLETDQQKVSPDHHKDEKTIQDLISESEGSTLEFKSSLRWDYFQQKQAKEIEMAVVKTLAAFLNTDGGTLIIGVDDEGKVLGLDKDYASFKKKNRDGFELYLMQVVSEKLGRNICQYIHPKFYKIGDLDVCKVEVSSCPEPVYASEEQIFFIRTGNATQELYTRDAVAYIMRHWNHTR